MHNQHREITDAIHCINRALAGLQGVADLMERGGDTRTAAVVRVLLEVDQHVGSLAPPPPTH
jgi:hypothetical protein